ncbi:MAG: hypothetical protein DRJ10_01280 [Bacteroidetes bacterium]|nr:MAG: hypothetical protein DRJ10_01280 [Bacteroidota bacterium]
MLNTVLDYELFEDFFQNQPKPIPLGTEEENKHWYSLWDFLKSKSDVTITNYKNQKNLFLTSLTTGRKGTRCNLSSHFRKPQENKFLVTNPYSVYFLNEPSMVSKNNYKDKNGLLLGFKEDYFEKWLELGVVNKDKIIPVRKNKNCKFKSWSDLDEYILPFTDMVFVDNYIFDFRVIEDNLIEIIKRFDNRNPVPFNLLFFSFIGNEGYELDIDLLEEKLIVLFLNNNIKCNLSIVLAPFWLKEHDRNIFTNYLRINSQDSFNYFKNDGTVRTKGTEIKFDSMAEPVNFNAAKVVLSSIKSKIKSIKGYPNNGKYLKGDLKNRLLTA